MYETQNFVDIVNCEKPHVVILGAGASLQAFSDGDKSGKHLPLMKDLIKIAGLDSILKENNVSYAENENFEDLYSRLFNNSEHQQVIKKLEEGIRTYFSSL